MDSQLPNHVLVDILLKLPIKEIIICKCTCKSWYSVISNPEFADLHFAQSKAFPMFWVSGSQYMSRICYILEQEKLETYMNTFPCQRCSDSSTCMCIDDMILDSKFKLPLRNFRLLFDHHVKFKPKYFKYYILNSCNGFLCLYGPSRVPAVVCNPVTGEFVDLPEASRREGGSYVGCGFGYCTNTNKYKVVRIFIRDSFLRDENTVFSGYFSSWVQVHTLGSGSWRDVDCFQDVLCNRAMLFPTYLNGAIHWLCLDKSKNISIVSFGCEKEILHNFPSPLWSVSWRNMCNMWMGILGRCLCITSSKKSNVTCWIMNDYGVEKSWSKVFEIDLVYCNQWPKGSYQPIKYIKNGALLMFLYPSTLVFYDPSKPGDEFRRFEIYGSHGKFEMVVHTPSFVSLKDVLAGCNVEVLNVNSRCAKTEVPGESRFISLNEYRDPEISNVIEDIEGLVDDLDNYL